MKKIFSFVIVATIVLFESCTSLGVATDGAKYFYGKKEDELAKYFKYDGEPIETDSEYDKVVYFTNFVRTVYVDKTTVQKFKNKRSKTIAKLEFFSLSDGCSYWTNQANLNYFGIDTTKKSYGGYGEINHNAQIRQGINNFNAIVQKLNAIENSVANNSRINELFENTPIGNSYYLYDIRQYKFGQYMDDWGHNESNGNGFDYSIVQVDVFEDSKSTTETHIVYIYDDKIKSYKDDKGNQISKEQAISNEESYLAQGFKSRKKDKGIALTAYIKDGIVVKSISEE